MTDACTHRLAPLSEGSITPAGGVRSVLSPTLADAFLRYVPVPGSVNPCFLKSRATEL
jgi:hypothetical protein